MRAVEVGVDFEIEQLLLKMGGCPEQRSIQTLATNGADQTLHEWM
jgi:hypothetical protein